MPRRIGTDRQMPDPVGAQQGRRSRSAGCARAGCRRRLDPQLVAGAGRRATWSAIQAPDHDGDDRDRRASQTSSASPRQPLAAGAGEHGEQRPAASGCCPAAGRAGPVTIRSATSAGRPATAARRTTCEPCGPRRSHSTPRPTTCASAVAVNSQRNTGEQRERQQRPGPDGVRRQRPAASSPAAARRC